MNAYIIIPTYNEAENLPQIIKEILTRHPTFHILIVDDNSPDGTGRIADELSSHHPQIQVIHRAYKAGLGTAYVAGFKKALADGADLIFEMDADFSHDPEYLQDFLKASTTADLVIGSRYINGVRVEGWKFRRLLLSKFANIYVSYIMVKPVWDFTGGFKCYHRNVLEAIDLDSIRSDGYAFQIETTYLAFQHGFHILEIPIVFKERKYGYSKISHRVIMEAFWLTLRCHAPMIEIIKHLSYLFKDYRKFIDSNIHYHKIPIT